MNGLFFKPKEENSVSLTLRRSLLVLAAGAFVFWLREVWMTAFLAVVLATLLGYPIRFFQRGMPRGAATLLTFALALAAAAASAPVFLNPFLEQARQAEEKIPDAFRNARRWLRQSQGPAETPGKALAKGVEKKTEGLADSVVASAGPALVRATKFGASLVALVALALFFAYEPSAYRKWLRAFVPPEHEQAFDLLWSRLELGLRKWVSGVLAAMTLMGAFTAIGLKLAGVQNWLLLGALTFFGTFVPYVGSVASAVPGLLVALSQSGNTFLLALGVYLAVHLVEGYIVEPFVMRKAVTIHPAILLLWQLTMGVAFGIAGFVTATPLYVCLKITIDTLYVERNLGKRPFPPLPEDSAAEAA
jgi:predicted PurR-regulated permease PerM